MAGNNFLSQLGTVAAGLGSGIKSIATALPQVEQLRQQAALRGAQEAQLRQSMLNTDRDRADLRASQDWYAQQMGVPVEAIRGYKPQEIQQMFGNTREAQMMRAAGMIRDNPVAQVVEASRQLQAQRVAGTAPQGEQLARQESEQRIAQGRDILAQLIQDSGAITAATKGQGMYRPTNDGGAFNTFYGTESVADPAVRSAVIGLKGAQAKKAIHDANRPYGRGGGGGHKRRGGGRGHGGGSVYVEEQRRGIWGQRNTRNNHFTPYPKNMQEGGGNKSLFDLVGR